MVETKVMSETLITLFNTISWAGVAALFIYFVLKPLMSMLINRKNGGTTLMNRMNNIEENHLLEINRRLENLELCDIRIQKQLIELEIKVARIETKLSVK